MDMAFEISLKECKEDEERILYTLLAKVRGLERACLLGE